MGGVHEFRWNEWNLEHVTRHGVSPAEAERIVDNPSCGWPRRIGGEKVMIQGRGQGGRIVQVIYLVDNDGSIFIIHAMPLTTRRRRGRRR
jgi:uncharacterized DUF497 family protein